MISALLLLAGAAPFPISHSPFPVQDTTRGKAVYVKWCAGCHGDGGAGDGAAAAHMLPRPRNFTGAIYKIPAGDQIPNSNQFDAALQQYNPAPNLRMGIWYEMEVDVRANTYTVDLTDLETGMIHRIRASDGADLGFYDHGVSGRANFMDAESKQPRQLPPIAFDPASRARIEDCPSGQFQYSPECWNFAPNGRRVWGLGVGRVSAGDELRLYYSVASGPDLALPQQHGLAWI